MSTIIGGRHRFWTIADQLTVSLTNVLLPIIIGRTCPKNELGLFAAGLSLLILVYSGQKALILTPFTVLNPRLDERQRAIYKGSTFLHQLVFGLLVCLGIGVSALFFMRRLHQIELGEYLLLLAFAVPLICTREYARQVAYAELKFQQAFMLDSCVAIIQLSAVATIALAGYLNARLAFICMGLSAASVSTAWFLITRSTFEIRLQTGWPEFVRSWFLARWLFASGLLAEMSVALYPWIITTTRGAAEAGVWGACFGIASLYNPLMLALFNEAAPRIAHEHASCGFSSLQRIVSRTARECGVVAAPFTAALLLFGGQITHLVYGTKYAGNGLTVGILALNGIVFAVGFAFPQGLLQLGRPGMDFAANASSFLVLVLLGWRLAATYGTPGAALGALLATLVAVLVKTSLFFRALKLATHPTGFHT